MGTKSRDIRIIVLEIQVLVIIIFGFATIVLGSLTSTDKVNSIQLKAKEALIFCKKNNFDTTFCILIDMNIHSGKKRFFVWDFQQQEILYEGLCSHGCCNNPWGEDLSAENPTFNNIPESHCSSLGKYKIGKRGYSNWGININYTLHGLEKTNSKAQSRQIVLHSWEEVSDAEIYPKGTPEGWGCPAISNTLMKSIDKKLKACKKSVLLWVYK